MLLFILFFLLLTAGSLAAFTFFFRSLPETENKLLPFAILPVPDGSPSTKAFLEFYASQISWMDSEILHSVLLVYPEQTPDACMLCEEMSRQYDFFMPVSVSETEMILETRLKNPEI